MKFTDLYKAAIRLFGIYILLELVFKNIFTVSYLDVFDDVSHTVGALISLAAFFILFNLIFFRTNMLLKLLTLDKHEGDIALSSVGLVHLVKFALVLVFVNFTLTGIYHLITDLPWLFMDKDSSLNEGFYERITFGYLVRFALGLFGLFNLNRITGIIVRKNQD